jgi:class 3 adenylate cyclase
VGAGLGLATRSVLGGARTGAVSAASRFARVVVFDRRGLGLSDRVSPAEVPTLEQRIDDVRAVLDDLGIEHAAILGQGYGSPIALLFAATYAERTSSLVLCAPAAKAAYGRTTIHGSTPEQHVEWRERAARLWGTREFAAEWLARLAPSVAGHERAVDWTTGVLRASGSPAASRTLAEMNASMDVRIERHNDAVRRVLARHGGREVDRAGDGFLATFDGPARAVRAALEIVPELASLELNVRAGVHTGEVELVSGGIGGIAVHVGARVAALGAAGEVLVTRTVRDLTVGAGIAFEERGTRELRGVPGDWELFAATAA